MVTVKRSSKHLKYTPSRRRWNLDATSFGPALKLALALVLLAAFVLLTIYVIVPFITARVQSGEPLFSNEPTQSAVETAPPKNPILTNTVKTVQYGEGYGLPTAVVDPSVYDGKILFATGADENACDRFVRLDPATGAFESIEAERTNSTLRSPVENAEVLIYTDVKPAGGGTIRMIDKATRENTALAEFTMGVPKLSLEAPYLVWMERTGETSAKLMVCDITSGELLTLAVFSDSVYADSAPSLKRAGAVCRRDEANPGSSLIRTVLLSDNTAGFGAGTMCTIPNPRRSLAYLPQPRRESDLYVSVGGGSPTRVARGRDRL